MSTVRRMAKGQTLLPLTSDHDGVRLWEPDLPTRRSKKTVITKFLLIAPDERSNANLSTAVGAGDVTKFPTDLLARRLKNGRRREVRVLHEKVCGAVSTHNSLLIYSC